MSENKTSSLTEQARSILDSHLKLGKEKPVSYLPLKTVERVVGITIATYVSMIEELGNQSSIFYPNECCIDSGAAYAYNRKHLEEILKDNEEVLSMNGWPIVPEGFIKRMATEWLDDKSPIMPVIRKAFGDA